MDNYLKNFEEKTYIHLQSFIIGIVVFNACCWLGYAYNMDILFSVSAIGILYLGYYCKDMTWGAILGAIGTVPFVIINLWKNVMGCNNTFEFVLATVCLLAIGVVVGALGAFIKNARRKAEAEAQNPGKNKKQNKKK